MNSTALPITNKEFKFKIKSRTSIEKFLANLKDKRDTDYINPKIIIDSLEITGPILEQIVNDSLGEGDFPNIFKISTIAPAPKIVIRKKAEDYRPINTLSTLDKLLEAIVKDQLINAIH